MTQTTVLPEPDQHIEPLPLANLTDVYDRRGFKYRDHTFSLDTFIDFGPTGRLDTMGFGVIHLGDGAGELHEPVDVCNMPCVKHMVHPIGELRLEAFHKKGSARPEFWAQLEAMLDLYIAYYEGSQGAGPMNGEGEHG